MMTPTLGARPVHTSKDWFTLKKQVLVSVDRAETRVALLEAAGKPAPVRTARAGGKAAKAGTKSTPAAKASATKRASAESPRYRIAGLYVERRGGRSIVGNIYKGKVDNVLPGLEAAFVDIGLEKNGFLHVDEIVLPGVEAPRRGRGGASGRKIADLLSPGQEIVVQVVKDPLKTKGARLSMELTIAGRYMVYAPTGEGVGIIRTAAHGAKRADFERELKYLHKLHEVLEKRVAETVAPGLVFQEADLSVRVVRDVFSAHFERAIVDDEQQHHRLVSFFTRTAPELVERVELWQREEPLFEAYGVDRAIAGVLSRRVDLPSGGYLMIDYAEALTVIDVNSGSFIGRGKGAGLEDTITKTNLEAAEEVVNQLRLRDIGGIIVIDFIDMARARNRDAVMKTLRKTLVEERALPFRPGDEVLVEIVEPHMYDVDDAVAKIDGYIISIAGAASHVGQKRMVRIDQVGRTAASALLLDDSGEPVAPAAEQSGSAAAKTSRARRASSAKRAETSDSAASGARARRTRRPLESEDADARREAGLSASPTAVDSEPEDQSADAAGATEAASAKKDSGAGDGLQSKPRRRGRRGGRRRSSAKAKATSD